MPCFKIVWLIFKNFKLMLLIEPQFLIYDITFLFVSARIIIIKINMKHRSTSIEQSISQIFDHIYWNYWNFNVEYLCSAKGWNINIS